MSCLLLHTTPVGDEPTARLLRPRLRSVLSRVHAAYAVVKDRAERAEVRLEMAELQLEQERAAADAYKVRQAGGQGGSCAERCVPLPGHPPPAVDASPAHAPFATAEPQVELQDELARLRAELTTALSMGGGGGHVDVLSLIHI